MRVPRIHVEDELVCESEITLDKAASHHLSKVLRAKTGDPICLFNGDGHDYKGSITQAGKSTRVGIESRKPNSTESPLHTVLLLGVSRGDRMDYAIQKSVELGVSGIIAFYGQQSALKRTKERDAKKTQHWQGISKSAAEQSGRGSLPELQLKLDFNQALEALNLSQTALSMALILHPASQQSMAAALHSREHNSTTKLALAIAIGPEQGFSDTELAMADREQFKAVTLGPRTLRTETAPVAALTVLQTLAGDLQ